MKGKVVFCSGGGSGIGLGICKSFGKLGAKVAICGRTESKLQDAAKQLEAVGTPEVMFVAADVRDPEQCQAAADAVGKKWGKIDVMVNNAAGNFMSFVEDTSLNAFNTVIGIDLVGCFNMAKAALPWMRAAAKQGGGATLLQTSATLSYLATPFQGHAAAAKAGIDSLTKTLAAEWASDGIRVCSIAPGPISGTEGGPDGRVFGSATTTDPRFLCPMGRFGEVDDIANTAVFLASPGGSFITGTNIVVDGLQWQMHGAYGTLSSSDKIRHMMKKQKEGRVRGQGSKGYEKKEEKPQSKL
jgi:peroxisomal 2,4-dienoyl-CoA reductase